MDHIAFLYCSSEHSLEVIDVILSNTDSALGISGEEVSKAVSHSHFKWQGLLGNLSHPLHNLSSPSVGQKLKIKKWSDRKVQGNFFSWNNKNQVWKVTYLIHVLRLNPFLLSFLIQSGNTPVMETQCLHLPAPCQSFTFCTVEHFQCPIYIFPCGL